MAINSDGPTIAELIASNRHPEAAAAAMAAAEFALAADLYEKLWDFANALAAARGAGDAARILRYTVELGDDQAIAAQVDAMAQTDDGARVALDLLVKLRRHGLAAPIAERLADERAVDLYTRAHRDLDAARLLEAAGRDRDAGKLLERALDLASVEERAAIQLALGRILARRGAYPEATRLLQEARKSASHRRDAQRQLVATLAAMGLRDGARDALLELRAADATIPADLDSYLRDWRDATTERKTGRDREMVAGRYRLDRLLGAGGSGRVFLATDEVAGRQVAVKMFFAAGARGGAAYERFVREAKLASTLKHPSLVEVYDVSLERGYLVMEFLPGGSLAQRLAGGEVFAPAVIRRMALDLIGGLEAAHHRGVVHRDVKPANIFFDARGTAKLGDFGVAHLVDLGQTQTGGLIGTLAYMSPEQITGAPISIAADLYALGVTLFEVVTGRLPFLGPDFVAQHLGETPIAATAAAIADRTVAPAWDAMLANLLVKNPRERTGTLGDLRHELEELDLGARPLLGMRPKRDSRPHSIAALAADDAEVKPRYQFETPLGSTAVSQLARAVDTVLDRSIIIERFDSSDEATRALDRACILARTQSPFVQRALSLDRATRTMIFEAPSGASIADAPPKLTPVDALRLLKRLARGIAAVHELGGSHGAIAPGSVVLDLGTVPTVLAAGLGAVDELRTTPLADIDAIVSLVAATVGAEPTFAELARVATAEVGATLPTYAPPLDGESLYAAADTVDIAVLAALGRR